MDKKIQTVVIGTSLTAMSDPVVMSGLQVARAAAAKVVLVHAFQPTMAYGGDTPYVAEIVLVEALEAERKLAGRRLEEQIDRLEIRREELAGRMVEQGSPHRILIEAAEAVDADLLVVGAAESPRLAKMFGSTADRVIRKSLRPVLLVRGPLEIPCRKVLLPVDLSGLSGAAFRRGLAVLGPLAGPDARFEALYVMAAPDPGLFALAAPCGESERDAAKDLESFVANNARLYGRQVATKVVQGVEEAAICARGEEWGADLIVLGTHGRSGFERFLLGSVAADVVRRGTTSVLVIPPVATTEEPLPLSLQGVRQGGASGLAA
jgi:nucleotide-binding universal stress UspA family protein